jgi:hypothetical protein
MNAFGNPTAGDFMGAIRDIALKFLYLAIAGQ